MKTADLSRKEVFRIWQRSPVKFCQTALNLSLAATQRKILNSIRDNRRTLIVSGNGVGKSYAVASAIAWWSNTRPDSVALLTSGSYSQMEDTTWRPLKTLIKRMKKRLEARINPAKSARLLDSKPPRIEYPEDEWFMKAVSPRNDDDLEGRHNTACLVVIEEADKPEVDGGTFDSAGSSITDASDRMVAIANPPEDESNVVYEKMNSDRWNVVKFSSFESHNVKRDAGIINGDPIPGLVSLPIIAEDWEDWNKMSWPGVDRSVSEMNDEVTEGDMQRKQLIERLRPGFEQVKHAHEKGTALDMRWYRRRVGIMPPSDAEEHRPFYTSDARKALERSAPKDKGNLLGVGFDIARKGKDSTSVTKLFEKGIEQRTWSDTDHNQNRQRFADVLDKYGSVKSAGDAVGEGSGVIDSLNESHGTKRFKAGTNPEREKAQREFDNMWTEGLHILGNLMSQLCLSNVSQRLREQLLVAGRVISFEEARKKSGDVLRATPKSELKEALDYSPDEFDSLVTAAWASEQEDERGGIGRLL
jgi:hypothetical protein